MKGLEAIFALTGVEPAHLPEAMKHIDRVVDIERNGRGTGRPETGSVLIDQGIGQADEAAGRCRGYRRKAAEQ